MNEVPFQPEALLRVLAEHEVACIVIGGTAAYVHGAPFLTEDVDITPKVDLDNYTRLAAALTELDARVRATGADPLPFDYDAQSLLDVIVWNLTTKFGDLDITVLPAGTRGYEDLRRDAVTIQLGATKVTVASLADVVRSKGAANRAKDRRALPVLRDILAQQTQAELESRRRNA